MFSSVHFRLKVEFLLCRAHKGKENKEIHFKRKYLFIVLFSCLSVGGI